MEKRAHFGLIDGASDSVGNHVKLSENKARGEPGFFLVVFKHTVRTYQYLPITST